MTDSLQLVVILLASAVLVVVVFRSLHLPSLLGYLIVGLAAGPHALGLVADTKETRYLAEFGVVFLMFSIGLEFSLPKLFQMRRIVFGLGASQLLLTGALVMSVTLACGLSWQASLALGGILAMSSTAIASRMIAERRELETPHGRETLGVLLFQDLAVVPLLIVLPALGSSPAQLAGTLGWALVKAAVVLSVLLFAGQRLMRAWFQIVARRRSHELFIINVLFITLALALLTERAGLSLALGAFLAGMLISETEYRHQVEEDIKPFREVLLGLFFVTVGMQLDLGIVARQGLLVVALFAGQLMLKLAIVAGLSRLFGSPPGTALRSALALAQAGEFGLVLAAVAGDVVPPALLQAVLASMLLTMFVGPFLIQYSDRIVLRLARSEWMMQSLALHRLAVQTLATEKHVVICGYGRTGQALARFFEREALGYVALDLDPERVGEAAAAGDRVVFGDASRRETLIAAGLNRASALVITFADTEYAIKVLHHVREINPTIPVIVRTLDDADLDRLSAAGATEVVPETFESSLMLASHAMVLLGVPVRRVVQQIRAVRDERYALLRGFFHGESDAADDLDEASQPRLHSVPISAGAYAVGKTIEALDLRSRGVSVTALRRREGARSTAPSPQTLLADGDVVVVMGDAGTVAAAEMRLLQGR